MRVDITPPRNDFAFYLRRAAVNLRVEPAILSVERGSECKGDQVKHDGAHGQKVARVS